MAFRVIKNMKKTGGSNALIGSLYLFYQLGIFEINVFLFRLKIYNACHGFHLQKL